jgi:hypothetical protein
VLPVTISDKNRKLFIGVGLEAIRRELTVGNNYHLPTDLASQAAAREWVEEQEREIRDAETARTARENKVLNYTFWTLVAAIAAVVVGVAAIVLPMMHGQ